MSTSTRPVDNSADIIDSREVIARIRYLEIDEEELDDFDKEELVALRALAEEASASPDWTYGETLIRDSYFEDYAREMAEDLGLISSDTKWPATCIDWEEAARELQADYTRVDFDGVDFWIQG